MHFTLFIHFLFSALCLVALPVILPAQNYQFKNLSVSDGLPENSALSIIQDHLGFIWIGTQEGLVRYDGHDMVTYQHDAKDSTSLGGTEVTSIIEDRKGNLWVGTSSGLSYFNRSLGIFSNYFHKKKDRNSLHSGGIMMIHEDDSDHIWVITRNDTNQGFLQKLDTDSGKFIHYSQSPENSNAIIHNKIVFPWSPRNSDDAPVLMAAPPFHEDEDGKIWIGTYGEGLKWYDRKKDRFIAYKNDPENPHSISNDSVISIFEDKSNQLWIGTRNGINRFDKRSEKFYQYFHESNNSNSISSSYGRVVWEDLSGFLWINTQKGLNRLNPKNDQITRFESGPDYSQIRRPIAIPIHEEPNGFIWFLSWMENKFIHDIYRYDPSNQGFLGFSTNAAPKFGLKKGTTIYNYFVDRTGILYIGLWRGGVNILDLPSKKFDSYFPVEDLILKTFKPDPYTIEQSKEKSLKLLPRIGAAEDENGILWIEGVMRKSKISPVRPAYKDSKGYWWASSNLTGFVRLDFITGTYRRFYPDKEDLKSPYNQAIVTILEDAKNELWFGSLGAGGLMKFISDEKGFKRVKFDPENPASLSGKINYSLLEISDEELLVATNGKGLLKFNKQSFETKRLDIGVKSIYKIFKDKKGRYWAGTLKNGFLEFDIHSGAILNRYTDKDGLSDNTIRDIIEDNDGYLWLRTGFGLSKFDPEEEEFTNFNIKNGLITDMVNHGEAFYMSPSGKLFVRHFTNQPLNSFFPKEVIKNPYPPQIVFTDFQLMLADENDSLASPLVQDITVTKVIKLRHFQNDFIFSFRALQYSRSEENTYRVKLEPYEKEWRFIGTNDFATYTNLDPGEYVFKVKAANCDGIWNEEGISMQIIISPPWWQTIWAFIFFTIGILALLYILYRYQLNRRLEAAETLRLKELDTFKTRLYTNITHEFRTPLTVITGMAEQISEPKESKKLILRNSKNLLYLVNEMLDLSKLESGKLDLKIKQGDVITYLKYLIESFQSYASAKRVNLHFQTSKEALNMDYDEKKLMQIVSNLLSNAIKFSPDKSEVWFFIGEKKTNKGNWLELKVKDFGMGIPENKLQYVFDRFYQIDDSSTRKGEGTGIGLTLTRELVHLLGGKISVESKPNEETIFSVLLPISRNADFASSEDQQIIPTIKPIIKEEKTGMPLNSNNDLPLVLIIEDNPDVIFYIRTCLKEFYQIKEAENGAIGVEKALKFIPDLIISDVMMPEKDGLEVCNILKNNERTSHIPIVLLTAKADIDSRLEGLQEGADVYLAKPFEKKELLIRMEQLIALRQKLQERYKDLHGTPSIAFPAFEREDSFLIKAKQFIEDNLSNDELSVEQLAQELGMSRSQLFRKLKALTGKSVILFIRSYRLARARQLLKTTQLSVSEVAYEVGFKSPAHFSTVFLGEFGVQPSSMSK